MCISESITSVTVSHDQNCLLVSCLDNTVKLFDRSNGELLKECVALHFVRSFSVPLRAAADCIRIAVLDLIVRRYSGHVNSKYKMNSCFTTDDAYVVSGSETNGQIFFWDLVEVRRRVMKLNL
jgi:mitogen-activated protein kinase organizer 1